MFFRRLHNDQRLGHIGEVYDQRLGHIGEVYDLSYNLYHFEGYRSKKSLRQNNHIFGLKLNLKCFHYS